MAEPNCGGCRIRVRWSAVYGSAVYGLAVYDLAVYDLALYGSAVYGPGHIRARYIRARCMRSRPMRARCILGPLSTGSLHMGPLDTGPLYARPLVKVCHVPASPVCGSLYGSAGPLCAEPLCAASANRTPTQIGFVSQIAACRAAAIRRLFPGRSLRPSKADAFTCPVFINELDSGSFKRLPNGSFVGGRDRNLSVNDLYTADRCYSDF